MLLDSLSAARRKRNFPLARPSMILIYVKRSAIAHRVRRGMPMRDLR
jgi:hypothetical protein